MNSMVISNRSLGVIILDYSREDLTEKCIEFVRIQSDCRIVVVENGRPSKSRYRNWGGVDVITNGTNLGFAAGMNVGIRHAVNFGASVLVLLNNDAWLIPPSLDLLYSTIRSDKGVGLLSPVITRSAAELRDHQRDGRSAAPPTSASNSTSLRTVGRVSGHCMVTRVDVISRTGLLDEDFFFIKEDDEFCRRVASLGFKVGIQVNALVYHPGSGSSDFSNNNAVNFLVFNVSRGRVLLARKLRLSIQVQVWMVAYDCSRLIIRSLLNHGTPGLDCLREMFRGLFDGRFTRLSQPPSLQADFSGSSESPVRIGDSIRT